MTTSGRLLLTDRYLNKGTAFTSEERSRLDLEGLLPPVIEDLDTQLRRVAVEYDQKDILSVRIDRKRKFHGTIFLRALGLETNESILRSFYTATPLRLDGKGKFALTLGKENEPV